MNGAYLVAPVSSTKLDACASAASMASLACPPSPRRAHAHGEVGRAFRHSHAALACHGEGPLGGLLRPARVSHGEASLGEQRQDRGFVLASRMPVLPDGQGAFEGVYGRCRLARDIRASPMA
jgi:hypothetical protein